MPVPEQTEHLCATENEQEFILGKTLTCLHVPNMFMLGPNFHPGTDQILVKLLQKVSVL
jgi:hypothetical protein